MSIIPANQLGTKYTRSQIVDLFCESLMSKIKKYAAEGRNDICFDATIYYENDTGNLYSTYQEKWRGHGGCYDSYKYHFDDYADDIRKKFRDAGYTIKPTGYIGGVWQLTEDICW